MIMKKIPDTISEEELANELVGKIVSRTFTIVIIVIVMFWLAEVISVFLRKIGLIN